MATITLRWHPIFDWTDYALTNPQIDWMTIYADTWAEDARWIEFWC